MKRLTGIFVGVVFCLTILAGTSFAADKLAYVDLGKIFGEYNKTKDYDKVLTGKEDIYKTERDKKVSELKQLEEKFNLLSEKEKDTKKAEITTKFKSFQEFDSQKQMDLRKEQDERMREILKDIQDAVKLYAEKEGYTLVFNDRVLVYQVKTLDISDKIIQIVNSKYVKK